MNAPTPVNNRKRLWWILGIIAGLVLLVLGLRYRAHSVTPPTGGRFGSGAPLAVGVAKVTTGDVPITINALGTVTPLATVTVHPQDALERGITDGKYVRVFNDRGQFVALARITDEIARGVVMAPMGAWPKNAKGHSTVNAVNPFLFADLGNAPTFSDTRVEIEPAEARTADR